MKKKKSLLRRLIRAALYLLLAGLVALFIYCLPVFFLFFYSLFGGAGDDMVDSSTLRNSLGGDTQNLQMTRGDLKDYESRRDSLAYRINRAINVYHKRTGYYPKSLNDLPVAGSGEFIQYHRGIQYYSGRQDKPQSYRLSWLASSPWNGMQCVGDVKPTDPAGYELTGKQAEPDANGCYVLDYH